MNTQLINRPLYLNRLLAHKDKDLVKVITGVRRSGKSSLLDLFHSWLIDHGVPAERIIHINFESASFEWENKNWRELYDILSPKLDAKARTYLILDEIQVIKDWERAVEAFRIDYDVDVYVTGSNSFLLSGEFATFLTGRYVEVKVLPLSFREFLAFRSFPSTMPLRRKFDFYLQFGGFPVLRKYPFDKEWTGPVLESICSTIIRKDIAARYRWVDLALLEKTARFLAANVGSMTSPGRIAGILSGERGSRLSHDTAVKYLRALEDAYVVFSAERYDIKGKGALRTLGKYYFVDPGLRNHILDSKETGRGYLLENIVYLELLKRGYRVYVGKGITYEVDFVAIKNDEKIYFQVCETIAGEKTLARELRSLNDIRDNNRKIILTLDEILPENYEGIVVENLLDWLLEG